MPFSEQPDTLIVLMRLLASPFGGIDQHQIERSVKFEPTAINADRMTSLQAHLKLATRELASYITQSAPPMIDASQSPGLARDRELRLACLRAAGIQVWMHLTQRQRNKLDAVSAAVTGRTMRSHLDHHERPATSPPNIDPTIAELVDKSQRRVHRKPRRSSQSPKS